MAVVIDSYSEANQNADSICRDYHPSTVDYTSAKGQSFTCSLSNMKIVEAVFYLKKVLNPLGNAHAVLYAHTGTYGTSSSPGAVLATSDDFDISTLGTNYSLETFTFSGAQQYVLQDSTYYCIAYINPASGGGASIDIHNYVIVGSDTSSPTHSGNMFRHRNGSWGAQGTYDTCFYVYGEVVRPVMTVTGDMTLTGSLTYK